MIRNIASEYLDHDPEFNWRGEQVTRIENLSDIVFAIALGMIVSAASPPTTLAELKAHIIGIIPVAVAFITMFSIWNAHFIFYRRFGLADQRILFYNSCLLLLVLFVAYPLRFVFDGLFAYILGLSGDWSRMRDLGIPSEKSAAIIITYFSAGLAAIQVLIALMHAHALSLSERLNLTPEEKIITRRTVVQHSLEVVNCILILCLASLTPVGPFAGFLLALNWFTVAPLRALMPARGQDKAEV